MSCVIDAGQGAAGNGGGVFDLIQATDWEKFTLELSQNAPAVLRNAWQLLKTKAAQNKFALFMGGFVAGGYYTAATVAANNVPPKLKFSGGKVGGSVTNDGKTTTSTTTSSACDPKKTPDENSVRWLIAFSAHLLISYPSIPAMTQTARDRTRSAPL